MRLGVSFLNEGIAHLSRCSLMPPSAGFASESRRYGPAGPARYAAEDSTNYNKRMRIIIPAALLLTLTVGAASSAEARSATVEAQTPPTTVPAPPDVAAPPADAAKTASGLATKVIKKGARADKPTKDDHVTVNYTGWTTDGKMFDSSIVGGKPATFAVDGVIPGWTEALQLMVEGEKMRIWIPEKIAYGGKQAPYGMLVFDVELIRIQ